MTSAVNGQRFARIDLRNPRVDVVEQDVVIDGALILSRSPADLDGFCRAVIERFATTGAGAS